MKTFLGMVLVTTFVVMALLFFTHVITFPYNDDLKADQLGDKWNTVIEDCRIEHQVNETEYKETILGKIPSDDSSKNLRCWTRCVMEQFDVMDAATAEFKPDILRSYLGTSLKIERAINKCESLDDANPCEKAFALTVCVIKDIYAQRA